MNTDHGFFQLFRVLKSLRDNKTEPALCEDRSAVEEVLPQINYSLLRNLPVDKPRYQQHPFRWERFDFGIERTCQCPD
jgi:hypothetical protein